MPKAMIKRSSRPRRRDPIEDGYRGPVRLPTFGGLDNKIDMVNLSYVVAPTTNASGVYAALHSTANVTSSNDWASFANVYQEFRVNAIQVKFIPKYNGAQSVLLHNAGATAASHDGAVAAPPTLDAVVQHATFKTTRSCASHTIEWRARGAEEMQFYPTTTTAFNGGIITYFDNLTPSTPYGVLYITFNVAFKARK